MPYTTGRKMRDGSPVAYDSGDYASALDLVLDKIDPAGFAGRQAEAQSAAACSDLGSPPASRIPGSGRSKARRCG